MCTLSRGVPYAVGTLGRSTTVHESLSRCIDDTRGDNYATATIFEKYKTSLRSIIEICDYLGPPLFKNVARYTELFCCVLRKNALLNRANPNVAQKVPCNRTELNTQFFAARQKFWVQHGVFSPWAIKTFANITSFIHTFDILSSDFIVVGGRL